MSCRRSAGRPDHKIPRDKCGPSQRPILRFPIINDGKVIAYNPIDGAEGTAFNKDVTIMLGNCKDDLRLFALVHNEYFNYTEDEPEALAAYGLHREAVTIIVDGYRAMLREEYGHEPTGGDIFWRASPTTVSKDGRKLVCCAQSGRCKAVLQFRVLL